MLLPDRPAVSRRTALRFLASAATAFAVGGCAGLAANGPRFGAAELVNHPTLMVATTRKPVGGARAKPWFGTERSRRITLARATLVPPDEGLFSLSSVGLADWSLASIEPVSQIDGLLGSATSGRDLLIYVHGFNNTFEAAALDAARLSNGIKFAGDTMVFSWPSRASLLDYMDVFTASVSRIGPLAPKVTIITATDDRALAVSRWVNGSTTRVGAAEKAQLEKLGLRVIDASSQGWGILNHDLFLSNAGVRQAIRDAIGAYPRVGAFAPAGIQLGGNLPPPEGAQAAPRVDSN